MMKESYLRNQHHMLMQSSLSDKKEEQKISEYLSPIIPDNLKHTKHTSNLLAELETNPLPDCRLEIWGPIGTILGWPTFCGILKNDETSFYLHFK